MQGITKFQMSSILLLAGLLVSSPLVVADLAQEVKQRGASAVGDSVDINGSSDAIVVPTLDSLPGGDSSVLTDTASASAPAPAPFTAQVLDAQVTDDELSEMQEVHGMIDICNPSAGEVDETGMHSFAETMLGKVFACADDAAAPGGRKLSNSAGASQRVERISQFLIAFWHTITLDLHLADYSRTAPSGAEVMAPVNPGPCYTSRAFAMSHIAMYDAYVGITRDDDTYLTYSPTDLPAEDLVPRYIRPVAAAVAAGTAAANCLRKVYNSPDGLDAIDKAMSNLQGILRRHFSGIPALMQLADGTNPWPKVVADTLDQNRQNDGSQAGPAFVVVPPESQKTFMHAPDPTVVDPQSGKMQYMYSPHWGKVKPFVGSELPDPIANKPPPLGRYRAILKDVYTNGAFDADQGPRPKRTKDQTVAGIFWAYDGGFRIGTPPILYNHIADDMIADAVYRHSPLMATGFQMVRYYACINVAMADAGIVAWRNKYKYNFWRPIIGIRRANEVKRTKDFYNPNWKPLGAPSTNRDRPGINPAFPAYPSGHATFGTSILIVARELLQIPADRRIVFHSEEFNGKAVDDYYCAKFIDCVVDPTNPIEPEMRNKRPHLTRTMTVAEAIEENKRARVWLGVHWQFDQDAGDELGTAIAHNVLANFP